MKSTIIFIAFLLLVFSCSPTVRTTDEIFVGLWKCKSILETDENGKDIGIGELITKYDGTINKIENTKEGYYFFLANERYTLAKINDTILSGDGFTLSYNEESQILTAKTSNFIAISGTTLNWVYEFYKQK